MWETLFFLVLFWLIWILLRNVGRICLNLNDRECGDIQFFRTIELSNYTITAKFLTRQVLNTEAIIRTFNPIWRSKNGFKVCNVGNHILLFVFDNEEEVEGIFEAEPWSFDKHLVMI